jgi:S-adenosylmethionine:tRNA ribosyltransferase-isomerase
LLVSDFHYDLPEELIAQEPLADRPGSRMLRLDRRSGTIQDLTFQQLPSLLRDDDLLVVNTTRVFPARLFGRRSGKRAQPVSPRNPASRDFLQGRIEVLLTRQVGEWEWEALVRPGRKIGVGERLRFHPPTRDTSARSEPRFGPPSAEESAKKLDAVLEAEVTARGEYGERRLRFEPVEDFFAVLEQIGHVPLPPYIARSDQARDRERYQTVYARERGSVAAPTAGLHFTPEILRHIRERGIAIAEITLHVGLGTFQPIHVQRVEEHRLHTEPYRISAEAAEQINRAMVEGRRVVAVGTTTVRTLEYAALRGNGRVDSGSGEADIFIYPGFSFRVTGAMLTNFHLPESTLLMLVCGFAGRERVLGAYRHAVEQKYRFYSYGDCMFVE